MARELKRICVYCGSSLGAKTQYKEAAQKLGKELALRKIGVVYGGASVGLMAEVANAALNQGGEAIGVIPEFMIEKELAHKGLSQLHIVNSMHERKALMAELSDAFIALPGGFGTFEELFETLTWAQLNLHNKPCGVLNVNNYYDKLLDFLDFSSTEGFVKEDTRALLISDSSIEGLLDKFTTYSANLSSIWTDTKKT
jgi:uncharacterized protein (TIGR00730 family)